MSWSLSASGHVDDPALEKMLAGMLGSALQLAGAAVSNASFSSHSFAGDPRDLVKLEVTE